MQALSVDLARAARTLGELIATTGERAWIVGGAPRDLALGLAPREIDMASRVEPDRIQALFERTTPLGRAFGTVIVHIAGADVEHTTFRTESAYTDARRPDVVHFGASVEEDARRRDFTCNAIFLDPLTDEVRDPEHGLDDLDARVLRCVGDPRERFREDALRPLRMARFAGGLGLEPTSATIEAARAEAPGLAAVSRERVLRELIGMFRRAGAAVAVRWMAQCELLEHALPGSRLLGDEERRSAALAHAVEPTGTELGLALLLGPSPENLDRLDVPLELLTGLKVSRHTHTVVLDAWRLARELRSDPTPARSTRVRAMRRPGFATAVAWLTAWSKCEGPDAAPWEVLARERAASAPSDLEPARLVDAADLASSGLAPGPIYGAILRDLETEQLELRLRTRDEALRWLATRITR